MSSPKTPPNSQKPSLTSIFRNFSRKQKKIVNVSVVGADGVGKSAFVVRFLTRRFIGDYSSNICCAYPHTLALDNIPTSIIVWDTPAISTKVFHIIVTNRNNIFILVECSRDVWTVGQCGDLVWCNPASLQCHWSVTINLWNAQIFSKLFFRASYNTANIAHKYINNRLQHRKVREKVLTKNCIDRTF